jgi:hypothetical protein
MQRMCEACRKWFDPLRKRSRYCSRRCENKVNAARWNALRRVARAAIAAKRGRPKKC